MAPQKKLTLSFSSIESAQLRNTGSILPTKELMHGSWIIDVQSSRFLHAAESTLLTTFGALKRMLRARCLCGCLANRWAWKRLSCSGVFMCSLWTFYATLTGFRMW